MNKHFLRFFHLLLIGCGRQIAKPNMDTQQDWNRKATSIDRTFYGRGFSYFELEITFLQLRSSCDRLDS